MAGVGPHLPTFVLYILLTYDYFSISIAKNSKNKPKPSEVWTLEAPLSAPSSDVLPGCKSASVLQTVLSSNLTKLSLSIQVSSGNCKDSARLISSTSRNTRKIFLPLMSKICSSVKFLDRNSCQKFSYSETSLMSCKTVLMPSKVGADADVF